MTIAHVTLRLGGRRMVVLGAVMSGASSVSTSSTSGHPPLQLRLPRCRPSARYVAGTPAVGRPHRWVTGQVAFSRLGTKFPRVIFPPAIGNTFGVTAATVMLEIARQTLHSSCLVDVANRSGPNASVIPIANTQSDRPRWRSGASNPALKVQIFQSNASSVIALLHRHLPFRRSKRGYPSLIIILRPGLPHLSCA